MRRLYWALPLLILLVLVGVRLAQKRAATVAQANARAARMKAPASVTVAPVRVQDVVHRFEYVGSVEAPLSVNIAPKVTGRIIYLQAREGDRVTQGQVLARIDPSQIEATVRQQQAALAEAEYRLAQAQLTQHSTNISVDSQVRQQQADLASARAGVKSAQASLTNAQAKLARLTGLYEQGFIAAQDVDDARAAQGVAQAALDAAKANVAQAQAALATARANTAQRPAYEQSLAALRAQVAAARAGLMNAQVQRADTVLTSPLTGYVTGRYLDPGAVASPGQSILAVQYMRQVWVAVPIPEEVSARVFRGMPAEVTFDALPGRVFAGHVTQINPSADPQSRQFTARVTLENTDNLVRPGMFAHVGLETDRVRGALVVPREAVQRGKDGPYVMVVDGGNIAHPRPVVTGASGVDVIALTSGVAPGDKVVTLSAFPLKDGQQVSLGGVGKGGGKGKGAQQGGSSWQGK